MNLQLIFKLFLKFGKKWYKNAFSDLKFEIKQMYLEKVQIGNGLSPSII